MKILIVGYDHGAAHDEGHVFFEIPTRFRDFTAPVSVDELLKFRQEVKDATITWGTLGVVYNVIIEGGNAVVVLQKGVTRFDVEVLVAELDSAFGAVTA